MLEYEVGDFVQGKAYLEELLEIVRLTTPGPNTTYALTAVVIPMVARITGVVERLDIAESAADAVVSTPSATPFAAMLARAGLALMAVQRGDVAAAEEHYAALVSVPGVMVFYISTDRLLGLLAQTMGNLDEAMAHFEDALAFCRKAGYRPELAWTCCDYADVLLQRNGEGNRTKAISLLDESLAIPSGLGMRPLTERVLSRREILGALEIWIAVI